MCFRLDGDPLLSKDNLSCAYKSGKAYTGEEVRIRRVSGEEVVLLVNNTPLCDAEGNSAAQSPFSRTLRR